MSALGRLVEEEREAIVAAYLAREEGPWPAGGPTRREWLASMLDDLARGLAIPPDDEVHVMRGDFAVARQLGRLRRAAGDDVEVMIRDFAAVCGAVCSVADDRGIDIPATEFQVMNLWLDGAICAAVEPYTCDDAPLAPHPDLGLVLSIRNAVAVARVAFGALQSGRVGTSSRTATMLDRSLARIEAIVTSTMERLRRK